MRKNLLGWYIVPFLSFSPLLIWATIMPLEYRFANAATTLTSVGQILGLVGITMFSLNIVLTTRLQWFEDFFGGMNKVYIAHHIFGGTAFLILLFHPIMLAFSLAQYSPYSAAMFLLPTIPTTIGEWWILAGKTAFYTMMVILVITFFVKLPYQVWRTIHKWMGVAFFFAAIHGFFVSSDISSSPMLKSYMTVIFTLGLGAFIYKTILGRYTKKQYRYIVENIKQLPDKTVEVTMITKGEAMKVQSGQFAFFRFISKNLTEEVHPFTISESSGTMLKIAVKAEGDYTETVKSLVKGDKAFIEGPYGRFLFKKSPRKKQVWVAGGIGITPFVGMSQDITPDYAIDLYYMVHGEKDLVYKDLFMQVAQKHPNFRFIPHYSEKQGRLTADIIKQQSNHLGSKDFFICGPPPMMASLRQQLKALAVKDTAIHTEEFAIQ